MAVPQLAIEYGTLRFILCMYFLSCSMVNMAALFTALFIYWFLAVLIGTAGIANYFFYKFFTDTSLYYTAYFWQYDHGYNLSVILIPNLILQVQIVTDSINDIWINAAKRAGM